MPNSPDDPHYPRQLRDKAESLLLKGKAMTSRGHFLSADALSVLFKLASSSENATDSLKILSEFQTHQIELDLQLEQIEANERENAVELALYHALYEFAPVAYFIISREGHITACNMAGAALFGLDRTEIEGQALENFLAPESQSGIKWQLGKLFKGSPCESCTVKITGKKAMRQVRVRANLAPAGDMVLMIISEPEQVTPD